jgi:hypothetical protein
LPTAKCLGKEKEGRKEGRKEGERRERGRIIDNVSAL